MEDMNPPHEYKMTLWGQRYSRPTSNSFYENTLSLLFKLAAQAQSGVLQHVGDKF